VLSDAAPASSGERQAAVTGPGQGRGIRVAFAAIVCTIAIGSFVVAGVWFPDLAGAGILLAGFPLLSFAVVGSFLVLRRAGDPIGWLLGAAGALLQLGVLANSYGYASLDRATSLPGGELALWFGSPGSLAAVGLAVAGLARFPDGRPPGRAFTILLWAFAALVAIGLVGTALADQPIVAPGQPGGAVRSISNPFALRGPLGDLMLLAAGARNLALALALLAPVALAVRFRRSRGTERQQLKWLTYTAAVSFGSGIIVSAAPGGTIKVIFEASASIGLGLLPVAIGIAITRYRLYDIDVLIRRTLIYAALSTVLLATYVGGVALLETILAPLTAGSGVAVAISTLAVVALFQPFRRRIQAAVDRRFYRAKYDAQGTLDTFAGRLRDEVDLGSVRAVLLDAVQDTVQPTYASVWLRR